MDHHGSGPPALDRLWRDAHQPFSDALADRRRCAAVVAGLYGCLSDHVSQRVVVCAADHSRRCFSRNGFTGGSGPSCRAGQAGTGACAMIIFDFVPIWTLILGLAVFFYVLLDVFVFDFGIVLYVSNTPPDRNLESSSIMHT